MISFKSIVNPIEFIFNVIIHMILSVFSGLIYILFFASGLFCVFVSGLIEYKFFLEIFNNTVLAETAITATATAAGITLDQYIAIFTASGIEIVKISIIFIKESAIFNYMVFARFSLIIVSGICALIIILNNLDNPNIDKVISNFETSESKKADKYDDNCKKEFAATNETVTNSMKNGLRSDAKKYQQNAISEYKKCIKNAPSKSNSKLLENNPETKSQMLISTLFSIKRFTKGLDDKTYDPKNDYNNNEYNLIAVVISLGLTITLEIIIYVVFKILSVKHASVLDSSELSLEDIGESGEVIEELTAYLKKIKEMIKEVLMMDILELFKRNP